MIRGGVTSFYCEIEVKVLAISEKLKELKTVTRLIEFLEQERQSAGYNNQLKDTILELKQIRQESLELIGRLEDQNQQDILIKRYLEGKRWKDIEKAVPYSRASIFRIHRQALARLADLEKKSKGVIDGERNITGGENGSNKSGCACSS